MGTEYLEKQAAATIPVLPKEHRKYQTMNLDDAYENGWYDALECVEKLPPVDVRAVVRGVWRFEKYGPEDYEQFWRCSVCADKTYFITNYCPNCGADMRGGDNDGRIHY